jgi:polysaccharide deacetylase family protein (PEP-CTERM system associated)
MNLSAFTVDVEDGVSIAMRDIFSKSVPQTDRVVRYTEQIMAILAEFNSKATFFVLGQVADTFPELIKAISDQGHELGVHGYDHWQFFKMTPAEARIELTRAKNLLEDLTGIEIAGHRAPAFSVFPATAWALDVIAECGFKYDSSIVPTRGGRYGWPGFPKEIVEVITNSGRKLIEVPISTIPLFGREIPFSGGGYLRLFPFFFTKRAFLRNSCSRSTIHYMHPYELDTTPYPDYYFEELRKAGKVKDFKMRSAWLKRNTVERKLRALLSKMPFGTMKDVIALTHSRGQFDTYDIVQARLRDSSIQF